MYRLGINNYAFIDSQNLNLGVRELGWRLDFKKFRIYLKDKYFVKKAYLFIGFIPENQDMYVKLQNDGYVLIFKPTLPDKDGKHKGNVDADLVLRAMIDFNDYGQAVIVTSDGDFYCLAQYLNSRHKLKAIISPNSAKCSVLLKRVVNEKIFFMDKLREKLAYIRKSAA